MYNGSIVVQEAISTGDPEIVQLCLQSRDYQRHSQRTGDVPSLNYITIYFFVSIAYLLSALSFCCLSFSINLSCVLPKVGA